MEVHAVYDRLENEALANKETLTGGWPWGQRWADAMHERRVLHRLKAYREGFATRGGGDTAACWQALLVIAGAGIYDWKAGRAREAVNFEERDDGKEEAFHEEVGEIMMTICRSQGLAQEFEWLQDMDRLKEIRELRLAPKYRCPHRYSEAAEYLRKQAIKGLEEEEKRQEQEIREAGKRERALSAQEGPPQKRRRS